MRLNEEFKVLCVPKYCLCHCAVTGWVFGASKLHWPFTDLLTLMLVVANLANTK